MAIRQVKLRGDGLESAQWRTLGNGPGPLWRDLRQRGAIDVVEAMGRALVRSIGSRPLAAVSCAGSGGPDCSRSRSSPPGHEALRGFQTPNSRANAIPPGIDSRWGRDAIL
jgi:hypothetical protein